jgi:hypothetical protein
MKKILLFVMLLFASVAFSQANGITYQAIIYNPSGETVPGYNNANAPLANSNICLLFTIVDANSQLEYQEKITITTDEFGMVNTIIGSGNQTAGYASSFNNINWSNSQKSIKVALDGSGQCSSFIEISNQPLSYVPLAFAANSATNVTGIVSIANGGTNATSVVGAKTNLGLKNVDNTSDLNKPISTATRTSLDLKEDVLNKSVDVTLSDLTNTKFPTELAVKTYISTQIASATIIDADATSKGKIQLTGDLGGTAALPTVPGLALKLDVNKVGVANGVASLNALGIIPTNQLPPVNVFSINVVASQDEMLALNTATVGSIAVRTDVNKNYILAIADPTDLANWIELLTPRAPVQSVNGLTGSISLSKSDIGLTNVDNTSDVNKPISNGTQNALNLKLDTNLIGVPNGTASLNAIGKIPTDQIPAISFSSVKVLSNQADMLALNTAVVGSVVIRTDVNKNYVLAQANPSVLANWIELLTPAPPVQSVNGYSGNISLSKSDFDLSNVNNTSDANKPISGPMQLALDLKANSSNLATVATTGNYGDLLNLPSTVDASTLSGILSISKGGTGSATKNFVDVSTDQSISGVKTFTTNGTYNAALTVSGNLVAPNIGSSSVVDFTHRIVSAATTSTFTKLIQFGTGGLSGSNTVINIGSGISGANNAITIGGVPSALTTSTTVNGTVILPTLSAEGIVTNSANGVLNTTSTIPVVNGGTGASVLTGYLKGNGTTAFSSSTTIPATDITGLIKKVNGSVPDADGNVAISFGTVFTGTLANRPAISGANGNIYVVSEDVASAENGRTFISDGTNWKEVTSNQSATDARYLKLAGGMLSGNLVVPSTNKITLTDPPVSSTDAVNKAYVDDITSNSTIADASTSVLGKIQLGGDLAGLGTSANSPRISSIGGSTATLINAAEIAANAATDSNTVNKIVKRDGTGNFSANTITANLAGNVSGNANNVTGIVLGANGGTGVSNSGKTITLGGNLEIGPSSGVGHAVKFSTTGTTEITLPTTGTLATLTQLDSKELSSNKSTDVTLGLTNNPTTLGDSKFPTQNAVKAYITSVLSTVASPIVGYTSALQTNGNNAGTNNVGFGPSTAPPADGVGNTSIGSIAMQSNTTGWYNTAVVFRAMSNISISGSNDNVAIGNAAAYYRGSSWDTNNQLMKESIYIGSMSRASAINQRNEIVVGYNAIGNGSNTIQLGNTAITNTKTNGTITAGTVTYPNVHGTSGQILTSTGSGTLTWVTPSVAVRLTSDQANSTTGQTSFTLSQTPLNAKIWMFINGARTNNNAYSVSGTTVTYTAANNNGYTLVINDRIQFDYCY